MSWPDGWRKGSVPEEINGAYIANQQDDWEDDIKVDGSVRLLLEARLVRESFCRALAGTGLTARYNSHRLQAAGH